MYCSDCGAQIPNNSRFCSRCGFPQGSALASYQQTSSWQGSSSFVDLRCPNCGGPLTPAKGEVMLVCQYCGTTVSLSSRRWSLFSNHYILDIELGL